MSETQTRSEKPNNSDTPAGAPEPKPLRGKGIGSDKGVATVKVDTRNPKTPDGLNTVVFRRAPEESATLLERAQTVELDTTALPTLPSGAAVGGRYTKEDKKALVSWIKSTVAAQRGIVDNADFGEVFIGNLLADEFQRHGISTERELASILKAREIAESAVHFAASPNEEARTGRNKMFEYGLAKVRLGQSDYLVLVDVGVTSDGRPYYDQHVAAKMKSSPDGRPLTGAWTGRGTEAFEEIYDKRFAMLAEGANMISPATRSKAQASAKVKPPAAPKVEAVPEAAPKSLLSAEAKAKRDAKKKTQKSLAKKAEAKPKAEPAQEEKPAKAQNPEQMTFLFSSAASAKSAEADQIVRFGNGGGSAMAEKSLDTETGKSYNDRPRRTHLNNEMDTHDRGTEKDSRQRIVVGEREEMPAVARTLEQVAAYAGGGVGAGEAARTLAHLDKQQFKALLGYAAKQEGTHIGDLSTVADTRRVIGKGQESDVYYSREPGYVIKVNNFTLIDSEHSPLDFFDGIKAFNDFRPDLRLDIIGFTEDDAGDVFAVMRQKHVSAERHATQAEINRYFEERGFTTGRNKDGRIEHRSANYTILDAEPKNVLVGKDGELYPIDLVVSRAPAGAEDGQAGGAVSQRLTSARTSLPSNDPALYKSKWFTDALQPGAENFDIGAGITTKPTERLAALGVTNVPFDPFNREQAANAAAIRSVADGRRFPTVTVANVLNVIAEPESRSNVILQAAKALAPDGKAFFDVYTAPREGETKTGTYQTAMSPEEYVPEIERWFGRVERHGSILIASEPKPEVADKKASWWDANPASGGNTAMFSSSNSAASVSPAEDAAYMDAVRRGDMETAARMVREAAEKAGYDTFGFHGTRGEFTVFDKKRIGTTNDEGWLGRGFYFWDRHNEDYALQYARGGKVMEVYLSMQEPYFIGNEEMERLIDASDRHDVAALEEFTDNLKGDGYDSVVDNNGQMLVFEPQQIKSADPVTYDDAGNVIPLSQRFDRAKEDIRFSSAASARATTDSVVAAAGLAGGSKAQYRMTLADLDKRMKDHGVAWRYDRNRVTTAETRAAALSPRPAGLTSTS